MNASPEGVSPKARKTVSLGHIAGVHGVRGWLKIHSLTDPRAAIFGYQPWLLGKSLEPVRYSQAKEHGKKLIALLENITDRDEAEGLVRQEIFVYRDQLPQTAEGEYYWTDLIDLRVLLENGQELGTVSRLMETGANDVLVVRANGELAGKGQREFLVPFVTEQYVKRVDIDDGTIVVDWDPEF